MNFALLAALVLGQSQCSTGNCAARQFAPVYSHAPARVVAPPVYRIADDSGQVWTHTDPDHLRRWVATRNAPQGTLPAIGLPPSPAAVATLPPPAPILPPTAIRRTDGPPLGPYPATVVSVHDGDTLRLSISLGFGAYTQQDIRVYGINAPELHSGTVQDRAKGGASRDYLARLLPAGTPVRLWTTGNQTRTFTRYVGSIALDDGRDLGSEMVRSGHAGWADADANPIPGPVTSLAGPQ